jgi:hypothetical protein
MQIIVVKMNIVGFLGELVNALEYYVKVLRTVFVIFFAVNVSRIVVNPCVHVVKVVAII